MADTIKFTVRIDRDVMEKLRQIADNHYRTVNREIEMVLCQYVSGYETKYGPLQQADRMVSK